MAAEQRESGGSGVIMVTTETGLCIERGYSLEPDLLIDVGCAAGRIDAIGDVMRNCGFDRAKTARWSKSKGTVAVDLFIPEDTEEWDDPGATRLPKSAVALLKPRLVQLRLQGGDLEIYVPDAVGFLAMKLEAKQRLRPNMKKDSFDMYAYVSMKGIDTIAKAILADSHDGPALTTGLASLFGDDARPACGMSWHTRTVMIRQSKLCSPGRLSICSSNLPIACRAIARGTEPSTAPNRGRPWSC